MVTMSSNGPAKDDSYVGDTFGSYYFYKTDENGNDVYRSPNAYFLYFASDRDKWMVGI